MKDHLYYNHKRKNFTASLQIFWRQAHVKCIINSTQNILVFSCPFLAHYQNAPIQVYREDKIGFVELTVTYIQVYL